jgi:glycosyltransferase involved in cell wall biosynthesis
LTDKFIVEYAGNMGYPNDMEGLLACAQQLAAHKEIHFLLLGGGAKRAWVKQAISERSLNNVTLLTGRPRTEQQVFLNACDVSVVSLVRGMVGVSVPSRMYNIMAAGKPIIAVTEEDSELAQVVREERAGWVVPPHDPKHLAAAIEVARADPATLAAIGQRVRLAMESKYSEERVLADYHRLFTELSEVSP